MAGIGVKLQKIYDRRTILANLAGFGYSTMVTIAPMFVVIGNVMLMSHFLGYETVGYARRGLFSGTILYIFIFSLLVAAPFNAVLSRYMSDIIYEESTKISCHVMMSDYFKYLFRVSVCNPVLYQGVSEGAGGSGVCVYRVLRLYIASSGILFHAVSVDLQGLSENIIIFLMGMAAAFGLAWLLVKVFHRDIIYSMLLSLTIGFS